MTLEIKLELQKELKSSFQQRFNVYIKEKHTQEECIGFVDGYEAVCNIVNEYFG
jgi:hypothetical protein